MEKAANPPLAFHQSQILARKMAKQFYGTVVVTGMILAFQVCHSSLLNPQLSQDGHKDTAGLEEPPEMTESLLVLFAEQGLGGWFED